MKILIFGRGQLGEEYREYFSAKPENNVLVAEGADIRDLGSVRQAILSVMPDVVINTAAKTNIDWCEVNRLETLSVNALGADHIGQICQELGIYFIHISSGCVQESKTAEDVHGEEDIPNPVCFYSWAKVMADNLLMERAACRGIGSNLEKPLKVLILRPRQLISPRVSPRNALAKMLTYSKFIDTPNSCTVVPDLMRVTETLMQKGATGIYNVVNPGVTSPYKIACMLREIIKPEMQPQIISKDELNKMTLAKRIDCLLHTKKLAAEGIDLPHIDVRLREIIADFKNNLASGLWSAVLARVAEETRDKLSLRQ